MGFVVLQVKSIVMVSVKMLGQMTKTAVNVAMSVLLEPDAPIKSVVHQVWKVVGEDASIPKRTGTIVDAVVIDVTLQRELPSKTATMEDVSYAVSLKSI